MLKDALINGGGSGGGSGVRHVAHRSRHFGSTYWFPYADERPMATIPRVISSEGYKNARSRYYLAERQKPFL